MSVLTLTITDKGKAAIKAALAAGKSAEITQVAFGSNGYTANTGQTSLQKEVVRLASVVGKAASPHMLHLDIQDDSSRSYTVREIGVYLKDGTLFALYAQKEVIFEKSAAAIALLTLDIALEEINAHHFSFSGMSFTTPPATINTRGVVMLSDSVNDSAKDKAATANAVKQANDNANRRETPSGAQGKVNAHASALEAHHAKQIVAIPTPVFSGMKNVQSIITALGDAARQTVGTQPGNVMPVGAFGIGGSATLLGSHDTLQGIKQSGLYCVMQNTPKDWPKGALNFAQVYVNYVSPQNASYLIIDYQNHLFVGSVTSGKMNSWQQVTMQDQLAKLAFSGHWKDILNKPEVLSALTLLSNGGIQLAGAYGDRLEIEGGNLFRIKNGKDHTTLEFQMGKMIAGQVPLARIPDAGTAASKNVGIQPGNVMPVGAFGIGGSATLLGSHDTLQGIKQSGLYCVMQNTPKDWPKGALNFAQVYVNYVSPQNASYLIIDYQNHLFVGSVTSGKMNPWQQVTMQDQLAKLAFSGHWGDLLHKPAILSMLKQGEKGSTLLTCATGDTLELTAGNQLRVKNREGHTTVAFQMGKMVTGHVPLARVPEAGTAASKNVGTQPGNVMPVGAFGWGGNDFPAMHKLPVTDIWKQPAGFYTYDPSCKQPPGNAYGMVLNMSDYNHNNLLAFDSQGLYYNTRWAKDRQDTKTPFSGWQTIYTSASIIPLTNGGTGAKSAEEARKNLGLTSLAASGKWRDISDKPLQATRWAKWHEITDKPKGVDAQKSLGLGTLATQHVGSELPVGSPVAWPTNTPPSGWLLCNGARIDAAKCPLLAAVYGTHLPDLRGYFIRGKEDNRAVLSKQEDQFRHHQHGIHLKASDSGAHQHSGTTQENGRHRHNGRTDDAGNHQHQVTIGNAFGSGADGGGFSKGDRPWGSGSQVTTSGNGNHHHTFHTEDDGQHAHGFVTTREGAHAHQIDGDTTGTGGNETRPRNIAFNYIVRAA